MSAQELQQSQKQTQSLVLAPQLRQSLKILQAPTLELRNAVLEELQTNPALEEISSGTLSLEEQSEHNQESANGDSPDDDNQEMTFEEDYSILSKLSEDWTENVYDESENWSNTNDEENRRKHFFDSLTSETSLHEHLLQQAELLDLEQAELQAIRHLIGNLDDRGFQGISLEEIARTLKLPLKTVEHAEKILQQLDPPGIGARDLAHCLLIQLEQQNESNTLAYKIVKKHHKLLLRRRIPELARITDCSQVEVQQALQRIAELDPAPGRKFSEDNNRLIEPDVTVYKDNGKWNVELNNESLPRLRLSRTCKDLIAKGKLTKEDREYIQDKMRSGKVLISAIEQRQITLKKITWLLLEFQNDFFEEGISGLKPLLMKQVAERMNVHDTTISRAIANKYMDTPIGVFEFRYFFTSGFSNTNGESRAISSIKQEIARIIEEEDPASPISDKEMVEKLAEKNIHIARRTIAKYREDLGILPTSLRKQYRDS